MVTIACPWCAEGRPLSLADFLAPEAPFTCPECGTSVALATEPDRELVLDLAAWLPSARAAGDVRRGSATWPGPPP